MAKADSVKCVGTTASGGPCKNKVSPKNPLYERSLCGRCSGSIWGTQEAGADSSAERSLAHISLADTSDWQAAVARLRCEDSYRATASVLRPFGGLIGAKTGSGELDSAVWVGPINEVAPIAMLATDGRSVAFSFTAAEGLNDADGHCLRSDALDMIQQVGGLGELGSPSHESVVEQDEWFRIEQMLEASEEYFFIHPPTGGLAGPLCGSIVTLTGPEVLDGLLEAAHRQLADAWSPSCGLPEDEFKAESSLAFIVEANVDYESGEPMGIGVACRTGALGASALGPRLDLGGEKGYLSTAGAACDARNGLPSPEPHAVSINIRHIERLRDAARALKTQEIELGIPRPTNSDLDFMEWGNSVAPAFCTLNDDVSVAMESAFEEPH